MRPRICYVLSLLRIHRPDCKHCMARLTRGDELRTRLEELNGRRQLGSHQIGDDRELVQEPLFQSAARSRTEDLKLATSAFRRAA